MEIIYCKYYEFSIIQSLENTEIIEIIYNVVEIDEYDINKTVENCKNFGDGMLLIGEKNSLSLKFALVVKKH